MSYQYHEFKNGLRLVHRRQSGKVSHIGVVVNAGSRDEQPAEQGMAHFIEHLLFKGTQKRSNAQVLSRLENVGADLNAFTTKEDTSIFATIQSNYFHRAIELLADVVLHSTFPEKEIKKEKTVVLDELYSYKDNPAEWIHDSFDEKIFVNHPLGRNILGTPKTLGKFNRDDILCFRDAHYTPTRMVVSAISNHSFEHVISIVERYFSEAPADTKKLERQSFANYKPFSEAKKYSRHQTHAVIGNIAYGAHDEHRVPMAMVNNMLGGPAMNSRLNLLLREKNGIAYNIESNYQPFADTGLFSIYCGTDGRMLEKAITLIHSELQTISQQPLTTLQLHTAVRQLKGQLTIALEARQNEMLAMGKNMLVYGRVETLPEIHKRIDAITTSDLQDVARQIFDPAQLSTLIFNH